MHEANKRLFVLLAAGYFTLTILSSGVQGQSIDEIEITPPKFVNGFTVGGFLLRPDVSVGALYDSNIFISFRRDAQKGVPTI